MTERYFDNAKCVVAENGGWAVEHDGGGFLVSSERIAIAAATILNRATLADYPTLISVLVNKYGRRMYDEGWDNLK